MSASDLIKSIFCKQNLFLLAMLSLILLLAGYLALAPTPWNPDLNFSSETKSSLRTHSYVIAGLWWAALVNLLLVSAVLAASRFYPRANKTANSRPTFGENTKTDRAHVVATWQTLSDGQRRLILVLSILAVVLSAWQNAPLLDNSLWGDEEATARRYIVGHVKRLDDGSMKLSRPSWERTLWNYDNGPNNHILFSILGRLSHSFARPGNGPDDYYFSESWIRLPSFLSGLGAIAATAWLVVVMGFPRSAPLVAFTLALHPWFVRWGTEARGYALELLFIPLAMVFLLKALRARPDRRAWGWWLGYGLTEFLLIYSHLGSVYFLFPLNIAAFAFIWRNPRAHSPARSPLHQPDIWRLAAANALGAFLTIQMLAPCLKPLANWLGKPRAAGDITWPWVEDWFSYYVSGMAWTPWDTSNPYCLTLPDFLQQHPGPGYLLLLLAAAGLTAGFVTLLADRNRSWLLLPLLAPGLLTVLHAKLGGNLLYPWYMVGFLPLAIVTVSLGLDRLARLIPGRATFPVLAILFLVVFTFVTQRQRQLYRRHPVEALAESVKLTREVINPFHPRIDEVITLDIVHATRSYDPAHLRVRSLGEFVEALQKADSSNKPLFLNLGNPGLLGRDLPEIGRMIQDRTLFEAPILIHGLQNPCTRYIFRYIPHSIDRLPTLPPPNN